MCLNVVQIITFCLHFTQHPTFFGNGTLHRSTKNKEKDTINTILASQKNQVGAQAETILAGNEAIWRVDENSDERVVQWNREIRLPTPLFGNMLQHKVQITNHIQIFSFIKTLSN